MEGGGREGKEKELLTRHPVYAARAWVGYLYVCLSLDLQLFVSFGLVRGLGGIVRGGSVE